MKTPKPFEMSPVNVSTIMMLFLMIALTAHSFLTFSYDLSMEELIMAVVFACVVIASLTVAGYHIMSQIEKRNGKIY